MQTALIIIVYNAAKTLGSLLETLQQQTLQPNHILAIECSSSDNSTEILKKYNIPFHTIKLSDFNHGTTRKYATSLVDADIYIFLTQDVRLANKDALKNLVDSFNDEKVGCAYGRQLPNNNATIEAAHLRLFIYPETNLIKTYQDRDRLGIKTCFTSDNLAAYRKTVLFEVGGFPENIILAEDMYVAAKMLIHGYNIAYRSDAMIYHSHNYTIFEEFKHYFDTGVLHAMNPWIFATFNTHKIRDSFKYLKSFITYCISKQAYSALPKILINVVTKYLGFLVGKHYKLVPNFVRKRISICNYFWE